jgi:hypothetical protein
LLPAGSTLVPKHAPDHVQPSEDEPRDLIGGDIPNVLCRPSDETLDRGMDLREDAPGLPARTAEIAESLLIDDVVNGGTESVNVELPNDKRRRLGVGRGNVSVARLSNIFGNGQ